MQEMNRLHYCRHCCHQVCFHPYYLGFIIQVEVVQLLVDFVVIAAILSFLLKKLRLHSRLLCLRLHHLIRTRSLQPSLRFYRMRNMLLLLLPLGIPEKPDDQLLPFLGE